MEFTSLTPTPKQEGHVPNLFFMYQEHIRHGDMALFKMICGQNDDWCTSPKSVNCEPSNFTNCSTHRYLYSICAQPKTKIQF